MNCKNALTDKKFYIDVEKLSSQIKRQKNICYDNFFLKNLKIFSFAILWGH
jgi:hypothetical protein